MKYTKIEILQEYARLEGSELGEVYGLLCSIANYESYLSNTFFKAVEKEINDTLLYLQSNTKIVTKKRMEEVVYKDLEWLGE